MLKRAFFKTFVIFSCLLVAAPAWAQLYSTEYYRDSDGDGYGVYSHLIATNSQPSGYVTNYSDCDDTRAAVNPGSSELANGIDDDCDAETDEGHDQNRDLDGDGYTILQGDCDDTDETTGPHVAESLNGKDDDCDLEIDEGFASTMGDIWVQMDIAGDETDFTEFDFVFNGTRNFSATQDTFIFKISGLPSGTYNVTETVPAGYELTSIDCRANQNNIPATNGINIVLEAGEFVYCTFNNTPVLEEPETDLSLALSVNPSEAYPGDTVTFTAVVENEGDEEAANVVVDIPTPAGYTVTNVSGATGSDTSSGGDVQWSFGAIAASGSASFSVTARIADDAGATVSATATVSSDTDDPVVGNDSDTAAVSVMTAVEETVALIGALQEQRSRLILDSGPSSQRRLGRLNGAGSGNGGVRGFGLAYQGTTTWPFSVTLEKDAASFSYSLRDARAANGFKPLAMFEDGATTAEGAAAKTDRHDIWVEGSLSKFDAAAGDGNFAILHAGADTLLTDSLLVGFGTQFDWIEMDAAGSDGTADGWGFMVGPYMTARLAPNLYFDARGAWGRSYNDVSPLGTYVDEFGAERWLATAALIGEFTAGDLTVSPEARLSWFRETSDAFVDSFNDAIPSVTTETGSLSFGPTVRQRIALDDDAFVSPYATLTGIWTFAQETSATGLASGPSLADEGVRARIEAGFDLTGANGLHFSLSGHYDGIGDTGYEAYGGKAKLGVSF